ncbi:hypothetical protein D3C75_1334900 [compost metagenome]
MREHGRLIAKCPVEALKHASEVMIIQLPDKTLGVLLNRPPLLFFLLHFCVEEDIAVQIAKLLVENG